MQKLPAKCTRNAPLNIARRESQPTMQARIKAARMRGMPSPPCVEASSSQLLLYLQAAAASTARPPRGSWLLYDPVHKLGHMHLAIEGHREGWRRAARPGSRRRHGATGWPQMCICHNTGSPARTAPLRAPSQHAGLRSHELHTSVLAPMSPTLCCFRANVAMGGVMSQVAKRVGSVVWRGSSSPIWYVARVWSV